MRLFLGPTKDTALLPRTLFPIAGLERELRRRFGDQHSMYRSLRRAAAGPRQAVFPVG